VTVISSPADAADLPSAAEAGEWDRAVAALASAGEVCLACHVNPDGDALGSMLACAQALRARGDASQRVVASFGDDALRVPSILRFLPGLDLLTAPRDYPAEPEVMITFDAASRDRLGMLAGNSARARELIVIDHHASNTRFGTINLVDPAAAATAVLACGLIDRLGVPLTAHVALGLYTGLVTDTGSFRYAATSRAVHLLAARLLAVGVEPEAVSRELWDRASFGYLRVLSAALGRATLEPREAGGRGLVWTTVPMADRAAHGVGYDALEPVIDVLRRTEEAEVAVVFKQDDDGVWQASARSKGNVDVAAAAAALGGGGHPAAAGFTSSEPVYDTLGRLRELLRSDEAGTPAGSGVSSPRAGAAGGSGGPPPRASTADTPR
jgi:bifunctional oligoribonuclease and PAP phosphatase NrnA